MEITILSKAIFTESRVIHHLKSLDLLTVNCWTIFHKICFLIEAFLSCVSFIIEGWITIPQSVVKVICESKVWGSFHVKHLWFKTKPRCKTMEMHKRLFFLRILAKNNCANWILFVLLMSVVNDWVKVKSKKVNVKVKKLT